MIYAGQVASIGLSHQGNFPIRKVCHFLDEVHLGEIMLNIPLGNNVAVSIINQ